MATKKAPPRRNTDVIRCENCGEEYSTTYKRCPFCDERPGNRGRTPVGGRRVSGNGRSYRPNPMQIAGLVISLALIITAVVIVFTSLAPMIFHKKPSGDGSDSGQPSSSQSVQGEEIAITGLTLSRTELSLQAGEPFQLSVITDPADAQIAVEWTSSNEQIATVDQYGNITNVYKGNDEVPVTIIASAGGLTASCTVRCTGDGTGEKIDPTGVTSPEGGNSSSGAAASGTLAPNTEAMITGASGGLNIRSGPGTSYGPKASTTDGAIVTVLEDAGNGWCKIKYATGGGVYDEGYVMFQYLTAKK
ncbi:MAG: Ig-like domain-containing protein [Oscillospiraceae bacterium]|jgi:hypothetical protein|nr:Ig-like domain-containing protein [Oscillospiraceae bacterium]